MGTRADFYVGRGQAAEWIGSIAWDGYPHNGLRPIYEVLDEPEFRMEVGKLAERDDFTSPDMGWPWPWETSRTTDYAYAYDEGTVWASSFGSAWFDPLKELDDPTFEPPEDKGAVFPDMSNRANFTLGPRSGVIVVTADASGVKIR